jgi:methylmalonyl-CoA/ethylmalonyl-CoA epimerase
VDLDHVALATRDPDAVLAELVSGLGGTLIDGGDGVGFRWVQVRLGSASEGMTVEVLVPWQVHQFDFLHRFLERHGPAQHHITFKTPDLAATLQRVRAAGFRPTGVNLESPEWKEAFLVPREAHGTVVQLAQVAADFPPLAERLAEVERRGGPLRDEIWWTAPERRAGPPAVLERIVLGTTSVTAALGFFGGLLGGDVAESAADRAELVWPGGGRIRLEEDGGRPGFRRLEVVDAAGGAREIELAGARASVTA